MPFVDVTARDNAELFKTLGSAFGASALQTLLDKTVPEIVDHIPMVGVAKEQLVRDAVNTANQFGVLDRLLVAASEARPERPDLRVLVLALSQRPGWSAPYARHELSAEGLERLTSKGVPFLDVARLARWMIGVENHVCQVRCGEEGGTGFLVGPDLVLTNHHVVREHLSGAVPAAEVQVRFDFRVSPAGTAPDRDLPWSDIDPTWKIPARPPSIADQTLVGDPAPTELDYALLKLAGPAGNATVPGGVRGWVDVSVDVPLPAEDAPILIVQHPGQPPEGTRPQQPLKIAFATPGFERGNGNGTRVSYRPSTLKGSSGSPVFGPDYRAVAIHHNRGQISPTSVGLDRNNRGIPLRAVRHDLATRTDFVLDVATLFPKPPGSPA